MANRSKQDPKRTRSELDLSSASEPEMAGLTSSDRTMLDGIQTQLQKLDLLQEMMKDIADLKKSVDFNNELIEELRRENSSLKTTVKSLQTEMETLSKDNKQMRNTILEMQCRSMQNNIVIMGLKEGEGEDYATTKNVVQAFMKDELKMTEAQIAEASIEKTHRLGQVQEDPDPEKPRAVVIRFSHTDSKDAVLARGFKLKNTNYSMFQQYPREVVDRRRVLVPIMKKYKAEKAKTRLVMDKLYVNNQLFRDKKITTWL